MNRTIAPFFTSRVYAADGRTLACRTVQGLVYAQNAMRELQAVPGAVRASIEQHVGFSVVTVAEVTKPLGTVLARCTNDVLDEDGERVCECGDEGRSCVVCAAEEAGYWATLFRAATLSERDPEAYEQDLRDAGRGHLVRS